MNKRVTGVVIYNKKLQKFLTWCEMQPVWECEHLHKAFVERDVFQLAIDFKQIYQSGCDLEDLLMVGVDLEGNMTTVFGMSTKNNSVLIKEQ